ncbi:hypothetical protein DERP_000132 [Dermatophagoides pteronyssinus]|uniref:Carboxylesterase type B domain-containing protein n=1 Tax=Dermatophagoides pteronyssinus TaxID=6956 RepID=A0ABQ8IZA7_DERPT|nr:hypothetical protein DERP_000132 [Dermatophagoides pteronyssinus]
MSPFYYHHIHHRIESFCIYIQISSRLSTRIHQFLQFSLFFLILIPYSIKASSSSTTSSQQSIFIETIAHQYANNNHKLLSQNIASESVILSPRTIQTKYGSIRGHLIKLSRNNKQQRFSSTTSSSHPQVSSSSHPSTIDLSDVETYLGVPYATPPTGGLRFMPPVTPTHWRGVRLVTRLRPVCPQHIPARDYHAIRSRNETEALRWMPRSRYEYLRRLIPMLGNQSEDCLYLNIYVPAISTNRPSSSGSYCCCHFYFLTHF